MGFLDRFRPRPADEPITGEIYHADGTVEESGKHGGVVRRVVGDRRAQVGAVAAAVLAGVVAIGSRSLHHEEDSLGSISSPRDSKEMDLDPESNRFIKAFEERYEQQGDSQGVVAPSAGPRHSGTRSDTSPDVPVTPPVDVMRESAEVMRETAELLRGYVDPGVAQELENLVQQLEREEDGERQVGIFKQWDKLLCENVERLKKAKEQNGTLEKIGQADPGLPPPRRSIQYRPGGQVCEYCEEKYGSKSNAEVYRDIVSVLRRYVEPDIVRELEDLIEKSEKEHDWQKQMDSYKRIHQLILEILDKGKDRMDEQDRKQLLRHLI